MVVGIRATKLFSQNESEYKIGLSFIWKGFLFTLLELFGILRQEYRCNDLLVSFILGCSVGLLYAIYELGLLNFLLRCTIREHTAVLVGI